jgi:hypothetical protein
MEKVFQMMKDPTNSAIPAKNVSSELMKRMPPLTRPACSAATWSPVRASTPEGSMAPMRSASTSAVVPSAALATTVSTVPSPFSSRFAVPSSKYAAVAPTRSSESP